MALLVVRQHLPLQIRDLALQLGDVGGVGIGLAIGGDRKAGAVVLDTDAAARDSDFVMVAIMGAAAIEPALAAIRRGVVVALANKECVVAAGAVFRDAMEKSGASVLPVDSVPIVSGALPVFDSVAVCAVLAVPTLTLPKASAAVSEATGAAAAVAVPLRLTAPGLPVALCAIDRWTLEAFRVSRRRTPDRQPGIQPAKAGRRAHQRAPSPL